MVWDIMSEDNRPSVPHPGGEDTDSDSDSDDVSEDEESGEENSEESMGSESSITKPSAPRDDADDTLNESDSEDSNDEEETQPTDEASTSDSSGSSVVFEPEIGANSENESQQRLKQEPSPPGGVPKELLTQLKDADLPLLRELSEYADELAEYRHQLRKREHDIDVERPEEVPRKAFLVLKEIRGDEYLYWQWHDEGKGHATSKYIGRKDDLQSGNETGSAPEPEDVDDEDISVSTPNIPTQSDGTPDISVDNSESD